MQAVHAAILDQEKRGDLTTPNQVELFAGSAEMVTSPGKVMTGSTLVSS